MTSKKQLKQQALTLVEQAHAFIVKSDTQYEAAGAFLVDIKAYQVQVRRHHKPMLDKTGEVLTKAREAVKAVKDGQATLLEPAQTAERAVKGEIARYLAARRERGRKLEAARAKVERARREKAERENRPPPEVKVVKPRPVRPKVAGVAARQVWKCEVVDESRINRDYMKPDLVLIRQVVVALGDADEARAAIGEGVRVWQEDEIAASGGGAR
jgi:hypothetical protein